jgi:hypothetical protein
MDPKEPFFGGLPEDLFNDLVAFLQATATCPGGAPGPEVAAALSVLVSLAQSEHAAAASTFQPRMIDVVFKALEIKAAFDALKGSAGNILANQLAALKAKLDKLTDFWKGK